MDNLRNDNDGMMGNLPVNINKYVVTPAADAQSIEKLVKRSGRVVGYQLSNGQQITKEQGVQMAKEGKIKGVAVAEKKGNEYLRSLPDSTDDNNLGNLPSV